MAIHLLYTVMLRVDLSSLLIEVKPLDIAMVPEIFAFIYDEALKEYEPSKYEIVNKLKFFSITLRSFAELRGEDAYIEINTLTVIFKCRLGSKYYWVFDIPEIDDKEQFIDWLSSELNKLL
ncbi:hypothetical protein OC498_11685 [Acinetobacter bohemicus]|uniref:hypothetical protein n=1 Tax=Acinetobacter TaxID=469 RepID=UPI00157CE174|nr:MULTISPECIES: hypothetical protein [Acinetobacter]MCO8043257.1 hypothetical protein [Acinetobacter sp. S4400-12]MCU7225554.1 hypothetical protein [Acinetobacter bohemicus]MDM1782232.1 hypothetical protein [Acinetobacter indicus]QKQ70127.1 hypothetical protein E5Y90_07715 [Acinetobacter sp. 10FS3-1]